MNTYADKPQKNKSQSAANQASQKQSDGESTFQFVDTRPEAIAILKLQKMTKNNPQVKQLRAFQEKANIGWQVCPRESESRENTRQRKIDYGDQTTNGMAEMMIPSDTSLYHATKREHVPKIRDGIDVTASKTTQLGKGFYTSWFSDGMEDYGAYVVRFRLNREIMGQQVFSDKIHEANKAEAVHYKAGKIDETKAVKGNWDDENDFLYTPKLDEKVDNQNVPHQVKITAQGVDALKNAMVLETKTGAEMPISDYSDEHSTSQKSAAGGLFAAITGREKK